MAFVILFNFRIEIANFPHLIPKRVKFVGFSCDKNNKAKFIVLGSVIVDGKINAFSKTRAKRAQQGSLHDTSSLPTHFTVYKLATKTRVEKIYAKRKLTYEIMRMNSYQNYELFEFRYANYRMLYRIIT